MDYNAFKKNGYGNEWKEELEKRKSWVDVERKADKANNQSITNG